MNFAPKFKPSFTLISVLQKQSDIKVKGFTLIEVLVVIAILGVLSSAVLIAINPNVRGAQARDSVRKQDLGILYNALVAYLVDRGTLPNPGEDLAVGSNEDVWLEELKDDYLKTLPKDPRQAGSFGQLTGILKSIGDGESLADAQGKVAAVTLPNTNTHYNMPILVLSYFPTTDGVNIDSSITGFNMTIAQARTKVNNVTNATMQAMEDGSKFRGYKNPGAQPALDYSIYDKKEYLEALPIGLPLKPGIFRPDYMQIMNRHNICDLVENRGVKEVWMFGWHHGNIEPVESNMAGPYGDISNSERTNDMPICAKTYVLYNFHYGRGEDTGTHNFGHQLEALMIHVDRPTWDTFVGPWRNYSTTGTSQTDFNRCGWTHNPPNIGNREYIYDDPRSVWTDCEDFKIDGSGTKVNINCLRWGCDQTKFHVWRMQNMPGRNNGGEFSNWWDFFADFDGAMGRGQKLLYDITPPTVPTNLTSNSNTAGRVTIGWTASADNVGVGGYTVKRDGVIVGSVSGTTFIDYTAVANKDYQYTVVAVDTSGNESVESSPLALTTSGSTAADPTRPILDSTSSKVGGNSAQNYTFLHSVGNGPNRYLVVGVGIRHGNSNSVASIKYKNINLTKIGDRDANGVRTELWGLMSPPTGIAEVAVSLAKQPSGGGTVAGATSWSYVNQSNPTGAYAGASGFSNNPTLVVPSTINSVVVDVAAMPSNGWTGTAGAGQTTAWNLFSAGDTLTMGSYKDGTPWISGMSWNTNNEAWSISGVALLLGVPPPVVIIPDPSPATSSNPSSSPAPSTSPQPQAEDGCPESIGNYCYIVSTDLTGFTLWAWLENDDDPQLWNKPGATCTLTPPNTEYYNFCMKY